MKKGHNVILFFYILIIVVYFNSTISHAEGFEEINNKILQNTSGHIVELGLKYEFETTENGEVLCNKIMDVLDLKSKGMGISVVKEEYQYCIEFNSSKIKGYIQYIKMVEGKMIIDIVVGNELNKIQEFKMKISDIVKSLSSSGTCFQYVKARTDTENMIKAKGIIENTLKKSGASKVKTIGISDGYSIMALAGDDKPMKVGTDLININCAVYRYQSGTYITIGTPIISINY